MVESQQVRATAGHSWHRCTDYSCNSLLGKEKICRAFNTNHSTIEFVGVDHGGFYIAMAKQLLDRTDSVTSLQ
jgi:hypothetical protein